MNMGDTRDRVEIDVRQLVHDTLTTVMDNATSSFESSDAHTIVEQQLSDDSQEGLIEQELVEESCETEEGDADSGFDLEGSDLARAHWIQLYKTNKQGTVIHHTLLLLIKNHKHMRPLWQFGKKIDEKNSDWEKKLLDDFYFRHHCASIQAAFTMIMENKDDSVGISRLLNEMGAHHFFYDANEPHFECFHACFMESLRTKCVGINRMDEDTEQSWNTLICDVKTKIGEGIMIQRNNYLKMCTTANEVEQLREQWEKVLEFGVEEAGKILCAGAMQTYFELLKKYGLDFPFSKNENKGEVFAKFCSMIMLVFNVTVNSWSHSTGFVGLPDLIRDHLVDCMLLEVCPSLLRKAVMDGVLNLLNKVLGEEAVTELVQQTWSKMYRVVEQAIIINIVEY